MTIKQETYCKEYLIDLNATQAAIRAGYAELTATQTASRLLTSVKVQATIQQLMKERSERLQITADSVLEEIAKVAFAKITDVVEIKEGELIIRAPSKKRPLFTKC